MRVRTWMTPNTVSPQPGPAPSVDPDADIGSAAWLMQLHRVDALAVARDGRQVGVLTTRDCLQALRAIAAAPATPQSAALADDPELVAMRPMPAFGDDRPGRPRPGDDAPAAPPPPAVPVAQPRPATEPKSFATAALAS